MPWNDFKNSTFLVTGATGLIGSTLVSALLYANNVKKLNLKVVALVRNKEKAKSIFSSEYFGKSKLIVYEQSDIQTSIEIKEPIDYVIHAACPTQSKFFADNPVETIMISVNGTKNLLDIARKKQVKGFVYLSSMEIYGEVCNDEIIDENHCSNINTMNPRNSYPEAKRLCEALCASYFYENDVPTKVIRLSQTFGPGVQMTDNRIFAQIGKSIINSTDIILQTKGETERSYLYTIDAVSAILSVLFYGGNGEVYNATNEDTYCSIFDMAKMVANQMNSSVSVIVGSSNSRSQIYPGTVRYRLSAEKLRSLGWKPEVGLLEMYRRMICSSFDIEKDR